MLSVWRNLPLIKKKKTMKDSKLKFNFKFKKFKKEK
ncbi:hypothetical protein LCGC14_0465340 [marine sediment metagenome]|uniref:Uncharacterized protein n=1 Tax=marine sediment metagenome TaxID=412755 RepID=A0A0F9SDP3_9ZZZZ